MGQAMSTSSAIQDPTSETTELENRTPKTEPISRLLTIRQTAEIFQVSEKKVRRLIKSDELVAYRIGRQLRIAKEDLRRFLQQRRGL